MQTMFRWMTVVSALAVWASCAEAQTAGTAPAGASGKTVGRYGIVHAGVLPAKEPEKPCSEVLSRKAEAERSDTRNMLSSGRTETDRDPKMLAVPEHLRRFAGSGFVMAATPPQIEFAVIPVEPRWVRVFHNQFESGWWGNYCQSNYLPSNGKFYTAVADHGTYDAHLYLVEYDPAAKKVSCLPEFNRSLGRGRDRFGDGIIHGWLDFYKAKYLPRPHLWFCTYWAKFPEPSEKDYATGYDGGHIASYDPLTREYVDYGAPIPRTSWPYHRVDDRRGMLYAVSLRNEFLAWDMETQKAEWAGCLPDSLRFHNRAILLDVKTGNVYTTNAAPGDSSCRMIRYDAVTKRFSLMKCAMPENAETGKRDPMRAQTRDRGPDGLFWGVTGSGELFSFDPDRDEVIDRGLNWPGSWRYSCSIERSPGGRYLYYQVMSMKEGSPVIQYDTKTGTRKVLAFLYPFYHGKYGYIPAGSYSLKLDDTGGRLFMVWNGAFMEPKDPLGTDFWGHCSVMLMHIPESERRE